MSDTFDRIYAVVRRIPLGKVATYGQIARLAGNPRLSRIVGCAMHAAPSDVPCQRVVNRFGGLCDAFEPLGKETHRHLLEMEGVEFMTDGNVDLARFQWNPTGWQLLMDGICDDFAGILGENLVGIYVHGSIAFGCFRWETGDVDFLAVVEKTLTHREKVALILAILARTPDAPPKGIEMSVVTLDACRNFVHPAPYELHFSNAHLDRYLADIDGYCEQLCGCDPDLAAHFTVVNACGIALYGRPAAEVFSPVPREAMVSSILSDVTDVRDGFDENPVYFTLNLCRTLAYLEENLVLSKKGGGEWALKHLPETHHRAIRNALKAYTTNEPAALSGTESFRDYALERLLRSNAPTSQ